MVLTCIAFLFISWRICHLNVSEFLKGIQKRDILIQCQARRGLWGQPWWTSQYWTWRRGWSAARKRPSRLWTEGNKPSTSPKLKKKSLSSLPMIFRKTNGVADATYGGYHISYEVKKLMYEKSPKVALWCPNQSMFYITYVKPHITIFRCCFVFVT